MNHVDQRRLGSCDVMLSAISLGTVKIGRNQAVKYPGSFDLPDDDAVRELLACALDHGVNTLDTAPAYGSSEQRLGRLLARRQDWRIISKAGEWYDAASGSSHYDYRPAQLKKSLENSLRQLKTDYLDCWLLHSDGNDLANLNDEVLQTLLDARQAGYVRSVGASTKTVDGGRHALQHLDCIMMAASLNHRDELVLVELAEQCHKGLLLKKIYDSGWALTGDNKAAVMRDTLASLFASPAVCSAVIGTSRPQHLLENINAYCLRHG